MDAWENSQAVSTFVQGRASGDMDWGGGGGGEGDQVRRHDRESWRRTERGGEGVGGSKADS